MGGTVALRARFSPSRANGNGFFDAHFSMTGDPGFTRPVFGPMMRVLLLPENLNEGTMLICSILPLFFSAPLCSAPPEDWKSVFFSRRWQTRTLHADEENSPLVRRFSSYQRHHALRLVDIHGDSDSWESLFFRGAYRDAT